MRRQPVYGRNPRNKIQGQECERGAGYDRRTGCEVEIEADELKLTQVIYNLINNAINYTGEDKKVIINTIVNKNKVTVEVSDTGKGIEKEKIAVIY